MFTWIVTIIESTGYLGIALLMLAENVFPPIPSELIMPLAGYAAAKGSLNIVGVIVAGTIGSLGGAVFWYYVGRLIGSERLKSFAARHGRWLTLTPAEVDQAAAVFERYRALALFGGRLVPTVRTLISVPAGIVRMALPVFLVWTTLGTALWTALLAGAGYALGEHYERVEAWVNPVSNVVVALLVLWYLFRLVRFRAPRETP